MYHTLVEKRDYWILQKKLQIEEQAIFICSFSVLAGSWTHIFWMFLFFCFYFKNRITIWHLQRIRTTQEERTWVLLFKRALVSLCGFVTTSCAPPFHRNHLSPLAQSDAQRASKPHLWCEWDLQISRSDNLTTRAIAQSRFCFKHPEPKRLFYFFKFFSTLWTWTNICGMFWHTETMFLYFVFWSVWLLGTAARAKWQSESSVRLHREIPSRLYESLEAAENESLHFQLTDAM